MKLFNSSLIILSVLGLISFSLAFYAPTGGPTSLNGSITLDVNLSSATFSSGANDGFLSIQKTGSATNRLSYTSNSGSLGTQTNGQYLYIKDSSGNTWARVFKDATDNLLTIIGNLTFTQNLYQNAVNLEFPWDRGTSDYTVASNISPINGIADEVSIGGTNPVNNFIFEIKNPLAQALDTKVLTFKSGTNPLIYATPSRIWGEGRDSPANLLQNTAGEKVFNGVKISKSKRMAHCDNLGSACPLGWWVCRRTNEKAVAEVQGAAITSQTSAYTYNILYTTPPTAGDYYKTYVSPSGGTSSYSAIFDSSATADDYICTTTSNGTNSSIQVYGTLQTVFCCQ